MRRTKEPAAKRRSGFTLIELLVVVAIIGILAAIILSKVGQAITRAREGRTYGHLATLRTAVNLYYAMNGAWPGTITAEAPPALRDWGGDVLAPAMQPYLHDLPEAQAGTPPFQDGSYDFSKGVYQTTVPTDLPGGNFRGWFYCNATGIVLINNSTLSGQGKPFYEY